MEHEDAPDKGKLMRYLHGTCSKEDKEQIEAWLAQDPDNVLALDSILNDTPALKVDRDRVKGRVMESITAKGKAGKKVALYNVLRVAASVSLICFFSYFIYSLLRSYEGPIQKIEAKGELPYKVDLEDGSVVMLNRGASIQSGKNFSGDERKVSLDGEAFFSVKRDEHRPFIITTEGAEVRVLGTSFNVRSIAEERHIVVTVASGSVRVVSLLEEDEAVILKRGEQAILEKFTGRLLVTTVDSDEFTAWKDGYIRFRNQRLDHILKGLSDTYRIKIRVDSSVDVSQRLTINQRTTERDQIFDLLSTLAGVRMSVTGDSTVHVSVAGSN